METIIEFKDFSWKYKSSKNLVLDSINFRINKGEFVGIMGATGAGKSTLCSCINGLIPLKTRGFIKGEVRAFGLNTREVNMKDLCIKVGLVFQDPETQFIMMTVEDELAIGLETLCLDREEIKSRIEWALNLVGLEGFENKSPDELSGGQKQRVAIASIMAMRPEVLILDEPTSDLDPVGKEEIFNVLEKIRKEFGLTIILVSHETKKILDFCDRVLLIDDGRIIFDGNPEDMLTQDELIKKSSIYNPSEGIKTQEVSNELFEKQERIYEDTIIDLSNISFTYPNGTQALKNISLKINRGDFVSVIGKNGSGKTTLIKHINRLLKTKAGEVKLKNRPVNKYLIKEIAQIIGYCYQNPDHQLFKNTIREEIEFGLLNLNFPPKEIEKRYNNIVELLNLTKFEDTYESTFYLSKGIRQRLALASVLVLRPEILIIDEPTTGQDFLMIKEFMNILQDLNDKGHTIIIVTHNPYVIQQYSKEVIILDEGRLIKKLPTKEFLKDKILQEIAAFTPI